MSHHGLIIGVLSRSLTKRPSTVKAIFTDLQFWVPVGVLILGFSLLVMVR